MYNVYLISCAYGEKKFYKIGWTKRDPKIRLKELKTANSQELELVDYFETKWGPKIESTLHRHWETFRREGEWFELNSDQVTEFKEECIKNQKILECLSNENSWVRESKEFSKYF